MTNPVKYSKTKKGGGGQYRVPHPAELKVKVNDSCVSAESVCGDLYMFNLLMAF